MEIRCENEGSVTVAVLVGRLDGNTAAIVQTEILPKIHATEPRVILDLSLLDYISSAGLRSLLDLAKKIRTKAGKLVVADMKDQIREIFEISGFQSVIPAYPDVTLARQALAR